MGLDSVELLMAAEEEFGIEFSDREVEQIITVGDLYDAIWARLQDADNDWSKRPSDAVWQRLRSLFVEYLGVKPDRVVKSAGIVDDLGVD